MKVPEAVLGVLENAECTDNKITLPDQLDRKLYLETDKVLKALGANWNRHAKAHLFGSDDTAETAAAALAEVLATGEVTTNSDIGYFPTPPDIAAHLIDLARLEVDMQVLEPSAGRGALAYPIHQAGGIVTCVEQQPDSAAAIRADGYAHQVLEGDFLQMRLGTRFDRVIMNPPFAKFADIHHVRHALQFLKPLGMLVSVMVAGVVFRQARIVRDFRELVDWRGGTITELPEDSFKASGTRVRSVVAVIPGGEE